MCIRDRLGCYHSTREGCGVRSDAKSMITVALSKGKLLEYALDLFQRAGFKNGELAADSRSLVIPCYDEDMTFLIVRPSDVPTYVEYGAADIGVVGKDMLLE